MADTRHHDQDEPEPPRYTCQCGKEGDDFAPYHDRYGIYCGRFCSDRCFDRSSYASFTFDAGYAGESLEEDY